MEVLAVMAKMADDEEWAQMAIVVVVEEEVQADTATGQVVNIM